MISGQQRGKKNGIIDILLLVERAFAWKCDVENLSSHVVNGHAR